MAEHYLDGSVRQPFWDRTVEPRLVINSGDTVVFDCPEPCGQVTPDWEVKKPGGNAQSSLSSLQCSW